MVHGKLDISATSRPLLLRECAHRDTVEKGAAVTDHFLKL